MNFWCLKAGGFLKQELFTERWILRWIFLIAEYKGKIRQKNPPENPPAGIEKSAGGEPPPETPSQSPPPPLPPPLERATPSPEPSGLRLAAPVCLCRWLVRSTSACGGSHLVAQPVSGGLHSFLGPGGQRGANAALAGTGHGFSEMHALSIFGVKVWALNIEKKSAMRPCKTWQDKLVRKNWAKNWAKISAHFRASFAVQNDPQIFSQNSSQSITPCLVAKNLKCHLRELLGFGAATICVANRRAI